MAVLVDAAAVLIDDASTFVDGASSPSVSAAGYGIQAAFGVDPLTTPVDPDDWTDITAYCRSFDIKRGRQHELTRTAAGEANLELRNTDGRFDPNNSSSPYYPNVLPMTRIRVQVTVSSTTYTLFTGYVEDWGQTWPPRPIASIGDAACIVRAVDAFKLLALFDLSAYSTEVLADSPTGYWRCDDTASPLVDAVGGETNPVVSGAILDSGPGPLRGGAGVALFDGVDDEATFTSVPADGLEIIGDLTVEAWINLTAADGTIVEVTHAGTTTPFAFSVDGTGYLALLQTTSAGGGDEEPSDGGTLVSTGVWHHVVATRQGTLISYYLDGVLDGTGRLLSTAKMLAPSDLTIGARSTGGSTCFDGMIAHVAIYDHVLTPERVAAHYMAVVGDFDPQLSGDHIDAVLDAVGWPVGERQIDAGATTIQATAPTGDALSWLLGVAEDTENGLFHISGDGKVTFLARNTFYLPPYTSSVETFGDGGGGELAYADLQLSNDDTDLWTRVRVSRQDGSPQLAEDAAAIVAFGPRTLEPAASLASTDADSLSAAQYLLAKYKAPHTRAIRVDLLGASDTTMLAAIFARELGDRVKVKRRPPGGGTTYNADSLIEGISISVTVGRPSETTWSLVPADPSTYWILGDATYSVLDSTTRLAY